jgi:hypothetical protein
LTHTKKTIWYTELGFRRGLPPPTCSLGRPPPACSLGRPPRVLQLRRRRPRVLQPRPLAARPAAAPPSAARRASVLPACIHRAARCLALLLPLQRAARPGLSAWNAGLPARPRPELLVPASRGHVRGCLRACAAAHAAGEATPAWRSRWSPAADRTASTHRHSDVLLLLLLLHGGWNRRGGRDLWSE